jgi:hypothetical protein
MPAALALLPPLGIGIGHVIARTLYLQWLLGIQLAVCLVLGLLVARRTGRPLLECLLAGLVAGAAPLAGYAVMLAAWRWLPRLDRPRP